MATVTERRTRRVLRRLAAPLSTPTRRRGFLRWLGGSLLAAVLVIWMLPIIIAHTGLLNWIVGMAASDLKGEVHVGSASLGWFSPIVLGKIEVRDAEKQPLASIAKATGDRSLLKILWNLSNVGRFRIEEPSVHVVVRAGGSNLEDALAAYLTSEDESSTPMDLGLEVVDGKIEVVDAPTQRSWRIERLQLKLTMSADATQPMELETSGETPDPQRPGRFNVALKLASGASAQQPAAGTAASGGASDLTLRADALPLAMFERLLARMVPDTQLGGYLSSAIECKWSGVQQIDQAAVQGSVTAEDFTLAMPSSLGPDKVQLRQLQTVCTAAWQGDKVQVDRALVTCDLGTVSLVGTLDVGAKATKDLLTAMAHQSYEIDGRLDVAKLARMLPNTLHIQQGTKITSGQVQLAMTSRPGPEGMTWLGRLEGSDLAAVNMAGRRVVWQQPILVTLAAHQTKQGPVVEDLKCESKFLQVQASGTPDDLKAAAGFDLDQLAAQLAELIDLRGIKMAGGGTATFTWKRTVGRPFAATGRMDVQDFQLAIPDQGIQLQENLSVQFSATGQTDFQKQYRLDTATLFVQAAQDRLDARLLEPVADLTQGGPWPLHLRMEGQLAQWAPRLKPWIALEDWKPAGSYVLTAQGTGSSQSVEITKAVLAVQQFRVAGHGLNVVEPKLEISADARWDQATGRVDVRRALLSGTNLAVQADKLAFVPGGQDSAGRVTPASLSANLACRGSLGELQQWTTTAKEPPAWSMAGAFDGIGEIRTTGSAATAGLEISVTNLTLTNQAGKRIVEPQVRLVAQGDYDTVRSVLQLRSAQLVTEGLVCAVDGSMDAGGKQTALQLAGNLDYDMEKLAVVFRPYLGSSIRVSGSGRQPLGYRGPFDPAAAQGEAGLGWTSLAAYGFRGGPAVVRASLSGGLVQVEPIAMELNEGRLNLTSAMRLSPAEVYVTKGSAARQVRIDPEMCANALKFIAPVLADVTQAEGKFSIELDDCRIPLADPAQGALKGRFIVHSVQVGPGPLIRELALLLGRESPAKLTRESVVPFQMANGRIYHEGLELAFPDLTIRTHGSVGLDHTLMIMAEMPVPPKWTAGDARLASALQGQKIAVPVNGTLEKPQLDRRTLDQLTRQFAQKAAANVIRDELSRQLEKPKEDVGKQLEKQFDKLFGPRK
jgi:translocation and assembly module TamB